jgi:hypothetical protein
MSLIRFVPAKVIKMNEKTSKKRKRIKVVQHLANLFIYSLLLHLQCITVKKEWNMVKYQSIIKANKMAHAGL